MTSASTLIKQGRNEEIWDKYCGFIDLSISEFMEIQERLLLEQIDLLGKSMMGRMLMGDVLPKSVAEFREVVPLTSYKDYRSYLEEKRDDVLPREPYMWSHTSGRSDDYKFKWVPYTKKMYDRLGEMVIGSMILTTASKRGEIMLEPSCKMLLATAPPPYMSGLVSLSTQDQMEVQFLPSLEDGEKMDFAERIAAGFKLGMKTGIDYFYGIPMVLVKIGEKLEQGSSGSGFTPDMLHPQLLFRMLKGTIKAKINKRGMLPKDIWKPKGIMTGGTDASIYKDSVEYYWGIQPSEGFGCTEGGILALQAWNYKGMTFSPDNNFLEFITHEEHKKNKENPKYQPKTVLYNELTPGIYELVFTNFHGGVFTRYRVGDLFEVISLRDEECNINLPQVKFYSRAGDVINLGGFAFLTENIIWQAIEQTGIEYNEWVARKELKGNETYLNLFIELNTAGSIDLESLQEKIHENLMKLNSDYADLENMLGYKALNLTLLNIGSFSAYMDYQKSQGTDLAHTKPPHMQPSKTQLSVLLKGKKIKDK
ncbi:MAG: GH3 auxin-responsive promoter family protein [Anaerolineales bacterium]|nr:GH3 auxin-responsive promoter family protein [Anaerolineales bacterium]